MRGPFCSFCGVSIDEAQELYAAGEAHICGLCVREFYRLEREKVGLLARLRGLRQRARQELRFARNRGRYREARHQQVRPIFVICSQRTGSSLLFDYLCSIPEARFAFEMLNHEMPEGIRRGTPKSKVLDHIRYTVVALGSPICGGKLFLDQLRVQGVGLGDLVELFPSARFIALYRQNLADQYVSMEIANQTGVWFYYGHEAPFEGKLQVSGQELLHFAQRCREQYANVIEDRVFVERGLAVSYETLVNDFDTGLQHELAEFLGVRLWQPSSALVKRNTRSLSDVVENYDDLRPLLESSAVRLELTDTCDGAV